MEQFSLVFCIYFFLFFCIKKKSGDFIPLTQKERSPRKHSKRNLSLFLRGTSFEVSHNKNDEVPNTGEISDQQKEKRLKTK